MFVYAHGRGVYGRMAAEAELMSRIRSDADIIAMADDKWLEIKRGNMNKWCVVYDASHVQFVLPNAYAGKMYPIEEIFDAEELFEEYHALRDIVVKFVDDDSKFGSYDKTNNVIKITSRCIKAGYAHLASTMKHEMQHAIQEYEKLHGGASDKWWRNRLAHICHCGIDDDTLCLMAYTFTAGEIEARQAGEDACEQCYDCSINKSMTDEELITAVQLFVHIKSYKESLDHRWTNEERILACRLVKGGWRHDLP